MKVDGIPVIESHKPIPDGMFRVEDYATGTTEAGGYVIKWLSLKAGQVCMQHVHPHAHCTWVFAGEVEVRVDGETRGRYKAGEATEIAAGRNHEIVAVTDAAWACIHYLPGEV